MRLNKIESAIARRSGSLNQIADEVSRRPALLPVVFEGLSADTARVKYGCLKVLRLLSEQNPALLYPEIERFFLLLDSDTTILKWGAILIIGNLAAVDSEGRIDRILTRYTRPISGPVMITAANTIGGLAKIAVAKPHFADRIARAILRVEAANYQTRECRNVAIGHAVSALDQFYDALKKPEPVAAFVMRQLENSRNAVRAKVIRFLRRHPHKRIQPQRT